MMWHDMIWCSITENRGILCCNCPRCSSECLLQIRPWKALLVLERSFDTKSSGQILFQPHILHHGNAEGRRQSWPTDNRRYPPLHANFPGLFHLHIYLRHRPVFIFRDIISNLSGVIRRDHRLRWCWVSRNHQFRPIPSEAELRPDREGGGLPLRPLPHPGERRGDRLLRQVRGPFLLFSTNPY